jgi:hypothetical protein
MKKLFFLILPAVFISASAMARIPAKITDAFHARYGHATNVEWKHGIGNYRASFNMGDYRLEAKFNGKGKWLESDKMLGKDELPVAVKNSLGMSKYGEWEIKSSYEEYMPDKKPYYYVIAAKGDFMRKTLMFNHRGQLVNG